MMTTAIMIIEKNRIAILFFLSIAKLLYLNFYFCGSVIVLAGFILLEGLSGANLLGTGTLLFGFITSINAGA
jgi:hypothetical protein